MSNKKLSFIWFLTMFLCIIIQIIFDINLKHQILTCVIVANIYLANANQPK